MVFSVCVLFSANSAAVLFLQTSIVNFQEISRQIARLGVELLADLASE